MLDRQSMREELDSKQYHDNTPGILSLGYMMIANPLVDSAVVNSFAKSSGASLEFALKTGIYNNHTIMGGNFLYNYFAKKKWFNATSTSYSHSLGNKFAWNVVSREELLDGAGKVARTMSESQGISDVTVDGIRTGYGISRNWHGLFDNLRKSGFVTPRGDLQAVNEIIKEINPQQLKVGEVIEDQIGDILQSKITKLMDDGVGVTSENIDEIIDMVKENYSRINPDIRLNNNNIERIKNAAKEIAANYKNPEQLKKVLKNGDISVEKMTDALLKHFKELNQTEVGKGQLLKIIESGQMSKILKTLGVETVEDLTDDVIEEAAKLMGKKLAGKTAFEKVMSSPFMRVATMAAINLPAKIQMPLTVGTAVLGMVSSVGRDQAINNFMNRHLYNTDQKEYYQSDQVDRSIYSSMMMSDQSMNMLADEMSKVNTASRYMNDLDYIDSSKYSYSLKDVPNYEI